MSCKSRQEYLSVLRERYRKSKSKSERSALIEEAVRNTGLHRKSVIRSMNARRHRDGGPPILGRPRKYSSACADALKRFYRASEYLCSDKLKAMIPVLIGQIRQPISVDVLDELSRISPASMDRYLAKYRSLERRRMNTRTRPGSRLFRNLIPIRSLENRARGCGELQADTVAHGGDSTRGEHGWSLTATDVFSGWTENRGFLGKHARTVLPMLHSVHQVMPFALRSLNVDNGSEFLNHRVYEYYRAVEREKVIPFPMTRSRSYHKNDNAHVEQKNWTTVRQLFGYDRIEDEELIPLMNEIYRVQNLISNFFVPQFKLKSKTRVGAKIKKVYDKPKTPYERVLGDPTVPEANKEKLRAKYATLNYFDLQAEKEALLASFEALKKELALKKQQAGSENLGPV